jgi:hypothetical protein
MLSRRNYLELTGFAAESFVVDSTPLRLNVQIRLPEKVEQPRTANYNWNGRFWRMQSTVAASRDSSALLQPGFLSQLAPDASRDDPQAPCRKTGIVVDIPKNHFGIETGLVEVRSRIGQRAAILEATSNECGMRSSRNLILLLQLHHME